MVARCRRAEDTQRRRTINIYMARALFPPSAHQAWSAPGAGSPLARGSGRARPRRAQTQTKPRRARKAYKIKETSDAAPARNSTPAHRAPFPSPARILRNESQQSRLCCLLALVVGCKSTDEFSLVPGQAMVVGNPLPRTIRVTALYPVRIVGPGCRATHALDFTVTCDAGQFTVTDDRPALLTWSQANHVTVSVSAF